MQAYRVLDEIKIDPIYQSIKKHNRLIIETYSEEIKKFQEAKSKYDQVMIDGGTYHPDFKQIAKEFGKAKSTLYQKPEVLHYFELEQSFQNDLNQFLVKLTESVSDHIKIPNKIGIVSKGGSCHVHE